MNPAAVEVLHREIRALLNASRYGLAEITPFPHPDGVFIKAWSTKGDRYSSRCTWRKTFCNYRVRLPEDFDARVSAIRADGRLWVNCIPLNRFHSGYAVYRVTWVHKSVGVQLDPKWEHALLLGSEIVPEAELPRHLCPS